MSITNLDIIKLVAELPTAVEIKDNKQKNKIIRNLALITDGDDEISLDWAAENNWAVVPREDPIWPEELDRLEKMARLWGVRIVNLVFYSTAVCDKKNRLVELTLAGETLVEFYSTCSFLPFCLIAEDRSFVIVHPGDVYFTIGGRRQFVEEVIGRDIKTARSEFYEEIEKDSYTADSRMKAHERYKSFNGS